MAVTDQAGLIQAAAKAAARARSKARAAESVVADWAAMPVLSDCLPDSAAATDERKAADAAVKAVSSACRAADAAAQAAAGVPLSPPLVLPVTPEAMWEEADRTENRAAMFETAARENGAYWRLVGSLRGHAAALRDTARTMEASR